tara:strand:- start:156 stop:455 length:300 start_codon:yes stop_codon:yes gene_type:complete
MTTFRKLPTISPNAVQVRGKKSGLGKAVIMAIALGLETPSKDRAEHKDGQVHRDHEPPYQHAKYRNAQRLHRRTQTIDGIIDRRFEVVIYFPQPIIERA